MQTALLIGYFVGAPPAAALAHQTNYKVAICVGLALYSCGALIFYPAGEFRWYPLFLAALLVIGLGLACLETSVSPYLLRLGRLETAQRRINFAAVFNPVGSVIGVLIGRNLVFSGVEHTHCSCNALAADSDGSCGITVTFDLDKIKKCRPTSALEQSQNFGCFVTPGDSRKQVSQQNTPGSWTATIVRPACTAGEIELYRAQATAATVGPYLVVAAVVAAAGFVVYFTRFPSFDEGYKTAASADRGEDNKRDDVDAAPSSVGRWLSTAAELLTKNRRFRRGVAAQFLYVGAQVGVW